MPIGIQRLNAKKSQPNPNIIFIKPLPGPNEKTAQTFLERIAAQCLPVMRKHHISVMTLEEYEPNREFVGRNFNAGEVVQLVLRSPQTGRWLPFDYVQMVMMHELAHCKQMNHSRAFWAVRNQYASQMYDIWKEGYTGDGIWGRGANLSTGEWERDQVSPEEALPEHLCGGTYRSRRRKRKVKPSLTYQERKERRILKKFGRNGVALGADEETKVKLEKGKKVQAKPKVAGSARGRELRAAAALARFEQQKNDKTEVVKEEDETDSGSETASDYEDGTTGVGSKGAVDVDGTRLVDSKGRDMVKVCEDEDTSGPDARNELSQLQGMLNSQVKRGPSSHRISSQTTVRTMEEQAEVTQPSASIYVKEEPIGDTGQLDELAPTLSNHTPIKREHTRQEESSPPPSFQTKRHAKSTCSMCSFNNKPLAVTCSVCANVLNPSNAPNSWHCTSPECISSQYVNSGDCGVCGLCGQRRS